MGISTIDLENGCSNYLDYRGVTLLLVWWTVLSRFSHEKVRRVETSRKWSRVGLKDTKKKADTCAGCLEHIFDHWISQTVSSVYLYFKQPTDDTGN